MPASSAALAAALSRLALARSLFRERTLTAALPRLVQEHCRSAAVERPERSGQVVSPITLCSPLIVAIACQSPTPSLEPGPSARLESARQPFPAAQPTPTAA